MKDLSAPSIIYDGFNEAQDFSKVGLYLVGFEYDGTACFRKGTRLGPNALRDVATGIETYSPYLDLDLENYDFLYDLGNLNLGTGDENQRYLQGYEGFDRVFNQPLGKRVILTVGGEHSISLGPIKKYLKEYPDLFVIHLDAHADLRDGYGEFFYSHASIIRRAYDYFGQGHELVQYGIRSGTKVEYDWMKEKGTLCKSRDEFFARVESIAATRPVYLTLDLDFFDPAYLPGTGTPEAGGEDFHCFVKLMKVLRNKNFVGADVVELSPELDTSNNSSVFATKVVREITLNLASQLEKRIEDR